MNSPTADQTLAYIVERIREDGYPPTRRQLGDHFGVSVATAQRAIDDLSASGRVERVVGQPRALRVVQTDDDLADALSGATPSAQVADGE